MEKSCLKIHFHFLQFAKKGWKSKFLEQNTYFFVNVARFAHTYFWAYSNLVGTPWTLVFSYLLTKSQLFVYLCNLGCLQWSRPTAFDFFSTTQLFSLNRRPRWSYSLQNYASWENWQNQRAEPVTSPGRTPSGETFSVPCTAQNPTTWYVPARLKAGCPVWCPDG